LRFQSAFVALLISDIFEAVCPDELHGDGGLIKDHIFPKLFKLLEPEDMNKLDK
jgi:hypothetical protein